jgi:hypothetical protein
MPTHPTRASSADRCPVEPPSPSSAEDLPVAPSGEEAPGAEDRESGQVGWKRLAPELPDEVIALLAAPVPLPVLGEVRLREAAAAKSTRQSGDRPDLTPRFLAPGSDDSRVS